ncbi:aryl-sulfate sulfotransferase [Candidatus Neomarinimicrobiota bacterium]
MHLYKQKNIIFLFILIINIISAENTVGLILNDDTKSFPGYTLFAPSTSTTTYLIDNEGRKVHAWESKYVPALSAYLLEDGNLLRTAAISDSTNSTNNRKGGFQKIAWDGTVLWEFYYGTQHHDIEQLPNGNILLVLNDPKQKPVAIQAGRDPVSMSANIIRSTSIIEVQQTGPTTGEIVWQWNAWDHLIQEFDDSDSTYNFGVVSEHPELIDVNYATSTTQDWLHTNSVSYNLGFDQILLSNRSTNEIWIIDHSTSTEEAASHAGGNSGKGGDLLYRWGNPIAYQAGTDNDQKIFRQHDAHWITSGLNGEGNILIFNNGLLGPEYSSIEEITPPQVDGNGNYPLTTGSAYGPVNSVWTFNTTPTSDFYSPRYGGSQRLPNGNTLICNSEIGEFFEVTPDKVIVWKYINPVVSDSVLKQGDLVIDSDGNSIVTNQVFRCYKYGETYPGLYGKVLTPGEPLKINDEQNLSDSFKLFNNYPNPFNPITNIEFTLTERTKINISIYDLAGNKIRTLVSNIMEPGLKSITWDSKDDDGTAVSSGVYFYNLQAGQQNQTKKMMLLR